MKLFNLLGLIATVASGIPLDKVDDVEEQNLINIGKAKEVVAKYAELNGIRDCVNEEEAESAGLKAKYDAVKKYLQDFKNSSSRDAVDGMISANLKANYSKAVELFKD